MLMRQQGLRPRARASTCLPPWYANGLGQGHHKRTFHLVSHTIPLMLNGYPGKLWKPTFKVFWSDLIRKSNPGLSTAKRTSNQHVGYTFHDSKKEKHEFF